MLLQQWYLVDMPGGTQKNFNNPMGIFTWRNNVRLPWGLLLDVDASLLNTRGDQENCHLNNLPWSVDVGLRKAFLNDRLSLQLQGRRRQRRHPLWRRPPDKGQPAIASQHHADPPLQVQPRQEQVQRHGCRTGAAQPHVAHVRSPCPFFPTLPGPDLEQDWSKRQKRVPLRCFWNT